MALTKTIVVGMVSISQDLTFSVREDTVITEDTVEISRTYFRYILSPGDDVSAKPKIIQDLATLLWTTEIVTNWKLLEAERRKKLDFNSIGKHNG